MKSILPEQYSKKIINIKKLKKLVGDMPRKRKIILYKKLNGGRLHSRVRLLKLPKDKDIGDLKGNIYLFDIEKNIEEKRV